MLDEQKTLEFRQKFENSFPDLMKFFQECKDRYHLKGQVHTMAGRPRPLPDTKNAHPQNKAAAERQAVNTIIQGSASDLVKMSMLHVHRMIKLQDMEARLLLQMHDELLFEVQKNDLNEFVKMLQVEMPSVANHLPLKFPVCLRFGPSWGELRDWNG